MSLKDQAWPDYVADLEQRVEDLEAALRELVKAWDTTSSAQPHLSRAMEKARAIVEGKEEVERKEQHED